MPALISLVAFPALSQLNWQPLRKIVLASSIGGFAGHSAKTRNTIADHAFDRAARSHVSRFALPHVLQAKSRLSQAPKSEYTDTYRLLTSNSISSLRNDWEKLKAKFFTYEFWLDNPYNRRVDINIISLLPVITHLKNKWKDAGINNLKDVSPPWLITQLFVRTQGINGRGSKLMGGNFWLILGCS